MNILRLGDRVALPYRPRNVLIWSGVTVLLMLLSLATLSLGRLGLGPGELLTLIRGEADAKNSFVFFQVRGPRLLVAILAGAAFGLSGALFQTVTRNPLGSPDVLGLAAGAGAGVALVTLFSPVPLPAAVGALLGAGISIGLVTLATGRGLSSTPRIIIAGIAVAALATAVTQFVVTATLRDESSQLAAYLVGTLNSRNMGQVGLITLTLLAATPLLAMLSQRLQLIELGDELATALGGRAEQTRSRAILLSVLLAAMAVAVAGPIAFVALMSPHTARMLTRSSGPNLVGSALCGSLLLVLADLLTQQLPFLEGLPVGVMTAGTGGVFLGYLLIREWRKER